MQCPHALEEVFWHFEDTAIKTLAITRTFHVVPTVSTVETQIPLYMYLCTDIPQNQIISSRPIIVYRSRPGMPLIFICIYTVRRKCTRPSADHHSGWESHLSCSTQLPVHHRGTITLSLSHTHTHIHTHTWQSPIHSSSRILITLETQFLTRATTRIMLLSNLMLESKHASYRHFSQWCLQSLEYFRHLKTYTMPCIICHFCNSNVRSWGISCCWMVSWGSHWRPIARRSTWMRPASLRWVASYTVSSLRDS